MTKRIIAVLSAVAVVYLLGAFVAVDIDFRNWYVEGRLVIAVIATMATFIVVAFLAFWED